MHIPRKIQAAVLASILFFVMSSPYTYRFVDKLVGWAVTAVIPQAADVFKVAEAGCPTNYGLLLHAGTFGVVCYLLMSY